MLFSFLYYWFGYYLDMYFNITYLISHYMSNEQLFITFS
jgi:hypothetical protein